MKTTTFHPNGRGRQSGFTLVEMMMATAISTLVFGALMSSFLWMVRLADKGNRYASVQHEAARSAQLVSRYIRNAASISSVDVSGNWVRLEMSNGKTSQFAYVTDTSASGQGRLTFVPDIGTASTTNIVAQGLTKVMTLPTRNVFEKTGANTLRLAYRVSSPTRGSDCAAEVDTGIRLRNF